MLLGIETTTRRGLIVLVEGGSVRAVIELEPGPKHGRLLVPGIRALLKGSGVEGRSLGAIAVGIGPGSFTGTRIGITAAKMLAYAWGVGLIGVETARVVVGNAPEGAREVTVIMDAQRGALYATGFVRAERGSDWGVGCETRIVGAEEWAGMVGGEVVAFGPDLDAVRKRPEVASRLSGDELGYPRPLAFAAEAFRLWRAGVRHDPAELEPMYLRRSSAEENWDLRAGGLKR